MNTDFRPFTGFKLAISAYAAIWGTGFLSYLVMPYLIGSPAWSTPSPMPSATLPIR